MNALQSTKEPFPRQVNDTRATAFLRYLRHPIDSIRDSRLARPKGHEESGYSLLEQAKAAVKDGNLALAEILFDGAASKAININDLVARFFLLIHIYDAEMQAGRPTFAIVRLEVAKVEATNIKSDYNRAVAFWNIEQRESTHPLQTRLPDLGDPDRLLVGQGPI